MREIINSKIMRERKPEEIPLSLEEESRKRVNSPVGNPPLSCDKKYQAFNISIEF